jgi:hypothetical protein
MKYVDIIASSLVGIIGLYAAAMAIGLPVFLTLEYFEMGHLTDASWFTVLLYLFAIIPAYFAGRGFWRLLKKEGHMTFWWIARGGIILGGLGLIGGMVIPIILDMGNQGPLIGIIVTGPGGLVVGVFAGFVAKWRYDRNINA